MRDRLIELLKQKSCVYVPCDNECGGCKNVEMYDDSIESIADHLLSEGVIVPPVKVGQTVYCIRYDKARKPFVKPLGVCSITIWGKGGITVFTSKEDTWEKTAFPTREEADKALERSENGKA